MQMNPPTWSSLLLILPIALAAIVLLIVLAKRSPALAAAIVLGGALFLTAGRFFVRSPRPAVVLSDSRSTPTPVFTSQGVAASMPSRLWMEDPFSFANEHPNNRYLLRVDSDEFCASVREAQQQVLAAATEVLAERVREQLRGTQWWGGISEDQLRRHIHTALEHRDGLIRDHHLTRTERPYGELFRCSILLDASPMQVAALADRYKADAGSQLRGFIARWGGFTALVLVIVLLYVFLNAATKGYFVWRLRAAAAMAVIVSLIVAFAMVG